MAWTQAQHDALERALNEGVAEVRYEDRTVKYRSVKDMRSLLADAKRELGLIGPSTTRAFLSETDKGL